MFSDLALHAYSLSAICYPLLAVMCLPLSTGFRAIYSKVECSALKFLWVRADSPSLPPTPSPPRLPLERSTRGRDAGTCTYAVAPVTPERRLCCLSDDVLLRIAHHPTNSTIWAADPHPRLSQRSATNDRQPTPTSETDALRTHNPSSTTGSPRPDGNTGAGTPKPGFAAAGDDLATASVRRRRQPRRHLHGWVFLAVSSTNLAAKWQKTPTHVIRLRNHSTSSEEGITCPTMFTDVDARDIEPAAFR